MLMAMHWTDPATGARHETDVAWADELAVERALACAHEAGRRWRTTTLDHRASTLLELAR